jgi:hypothetical protein
MLWIFGRRQDLQYEAYDNLVGAYQVDERLDVLEVYQILV